VLKPAENAMQTFEWVDATSVEQAAALLAAGRADRPVVAKAGGVDLIDLMKEGIIRPSRVVNLKSIAGLDEITSSDAGALTLGAMVTLARIDADPEVRRRFPALADAAHHAATPQVRNAATIGGNLLQRPRCWYFRNAHFHREGADPAAAAIEGENQYHAIFDNARSAMVHASTPATALMAYGAEVELTGEHGKSRTALLKDFLLAPDAARDRDVAMLPGEVLTGVRIPASGKETRAAYHKQTERDSYDWPICDVAVVLEMDKAIVRDASIVLGWVAPTPRRAAECERILRGNSVTDAIAREAAKASIAGVTPLSKNSYKVPVLETVVRRTILAAAAA
jgi:xanthine dehydrogenase YagS FAD-binding subunit